MSRSAVSTEALAIEGLRPRPKRLQTLLRTARSKPFGTISAVVLIALVLIAIFAGQIAPADPNKMFPGARLLAPGERGFIFGSDTLGRDVLSRIIHGSRISLYVGIMSVALGTVGGTIIGLISGFFEGKIDIVLQRIMDSIMCVPGLVLALAIMAVLGQSITNVLIALAIIIAPADSRVVRGAVLSVKQNQYIEAARCIGASNWRILARHISPNVMAPVLIIASVWLGNAIIIEASLSYLGLGTPPPTPTWGGMLSGEGRQNMEQSPWLAVFPGLAISVVVLSFNMFGDALRDILDPRLRGSQ